MIVTARNHEDMWDRVGERLAELAEEVRRLRYDQGRDRQAMDTMAQTVSLTFQTVLQIWGAVDPANQPAASPLADALEAILGRLTAIEQALATLARRPG